MDINIDGNNYKIDESNKQIMGVVNTLQLGNTNLHKDEGQNFALLNHIVLCVQAVQEGKVKELKSLLENEKPKKKTKSKKKK